MSLYDRLAGINEVETEVSPGVWSDRKIIIHAFAAAIEEYRKGKITGVEFQDLFDLDANEVSDAQALRDLVIVAPNKMEFLRVFKDCLYLAEARYMYLTQGTFFGRLQTEVTDQGGTLP